MGVYLNLTKISKPQGSLAGAVARSVSGYGAVPGVFKHTHPRNNGRFSCHPCLSTPSTCVFVLNGWCAIGGWVEALGGGWKGMGGMGKKNSLLRCALTRVDSAVPGPAKAGPLPKI